MRFIIVPKPAVAGSSNEKTGLSEQRLLPAGTTSNTLYQPGLDIELTNFGRSRQASLASSHAPLGAVRQHPVRVLDQLCVRTCVLICDALACRTPSLRNSPLWGLLRVCLLRRLRKAPWRPNFRRWEDCFRVQHSRLWLAVFPSCSLPGCLAGWSHRHIPLPQLLVTRPRLHCQVLTERRG